VRAAPFILILALSLTAEAKKPAPTPAPSRSRQVLDSPDLTREFNIQQLSPFGRSKSEFTAHGAQTSSFYIHQKYTPKGYDTNGFRTKTAWDSDFKFSTKAARTKTYETKEAAAASKTAAVKDAREGSKTAATREFYEANRKTSFTGRNQALFDKEGPAAQAKVGASWSGNLKQLTVEDVREILNKNK
jgi:hypothetical protein